MRVKRLVAYDYSNKRINFTILSLIFYAITSADSYIVVFLREQGYTNSIIGAIMALVAFTRFLGQPFWGVVADRIHSLKRVFIFCLLLSSVLFAMLPFFQAIIIIILLLATSSFFKSPLIPILDSWVVSEISNETKINYGSLRVWGSIGYAIVVYLYGRFIDMYSANIIFFINFGLAAFTVLVCSRVKEGNIDYKTGIKNMDFRLLFRNYYYVVFILFALVLNISIIASRTFLPNLVESLGGTRTQLGISYSVMAIAEIPFFILGNYLMEKLGYIKLIIIASTFYILQQLIYLMSSSPVHIVYATLIRGPAYSLFLIGMIYYVHLLAPGGLKATAQTVASAFSMGLSAIAGNYFGGLIIDLFGLKSLYKITVSTIIIILIIFLLSFPLGKHLTGGFPGFSTGVRED